MSPSDGARKKPIADSTFQTPEEISAMVLVLEKTKETLKAYIGESHPCRRHYSPGYVFRRHLPSIM